MPYMKYRKKTVWQEMVQDVGTFVGIMAYAIALLFGAFIVIALGLGAAFLGAELATLG